MSDHPWQTDQWFVSPWNFADEVRAELHFAPHIQVHDVTLRDGEQQTGITFTQDEKIRIAEALAEAGVHRIEAGLPVVSPNDTAAIKAIVKRNLGPKIYAFSRCMVDDVKRAALLAEATDVALNDVGLIPIHYQKNTWAAKKGLKVTPRSDEYTLAMSVTP